MISGVLRPYVIASWIASRPDLCNDAWCMRTKTYRWLLAALAAVVTAVPIAALWAGWNGHRASVYAELKREADVYAEYTAQTLYTVQLAFEGAEAELAERDWPDLFNDRGARTVLRSKASSLPMLRAIWMAAPSGRMVLLSSQFPTPNLNVGKRDYFQAAQAAPAQIQVARPRIGLYTGKPFISLSFGLQTGELRDGVVAAAVEPDYLERLPLTGNEDIDRGFIGLIREDGVILTMKPYKQEMIGGAFEFGPDTKPVGTGEALFQGTLAGLDGEWVVALRKARDFPVVAVAVRKVDTIWQGWLDDRMTFIVLILVAMFAFHAGGLVLVRHLNREARYVRELEASRTALKANEDELRRSNAELEEFAYVASHDLREPLRMVNSYLNLLERRSAGTLGNESVEFLRFARDGARRMDRLILDLLEYSRVGRGKRPQEVVDMGECVQGALQHLLRSVKDARVDIAPGMPSVPGNPSELLRLWQNLIGNALKYRHPAHPCVVTIGFQHVAGGRVRFSIRDNGIGFAPDQAERIFGVFQRLHTSDAYDGTGVGLAVCRKIVEQHGGHLWAESEGEGQGATFYFELPASPVAVERPVAAE